MTETAVGTAERESRWEDFVDIYFAPRDLFARRADESWIKPFLLFCAVSIVLYYLFLPLNGLVWEAAMAENAPPGANAEQVRQSAQFMKYLGGVFVPFGFAFVVAVTALGLKLVSSVLEPAASWGQAFLIATFSIYVVLVQQIAGTLAVFVKSRSSAVSTADVSFGALRFVQDPDPVLKAVLGRLDIFPIWSALLCAIGLIVLAGMPRAKAFATAAIAWLLVALPGVVSALLFGGRN
ncbi:MAG: YIP1 family protein [Gemmatimonadota bacterium]